MRRDRNARRWQNGCRGQTSGQLESFSLPVALTRTTEQVRHLISPILPPRYRILAFFARERAWQTRFRRASNSESDEGQGSHAEFNQYQRHHEWYDSPR